MFVILYNIKLSVIKNKGDYFGFNKCYITFLLCYIILTFAGKQEPMPVRPLAPMAGAKSQE